MDVEISRMDHIDLVVLRGRLDASSAGHASASLSTLVAQPSPRVLVCLADLHSISSAGLRVILVLAQKVHGAGGRLALCELSAASQPVLEMSGMLEFLPVFVGRADAMVHLTG